MKTGIHPETYRLVAFKDMSNDQVFITRSCANTKETIEIDGVTYPVVKLEISNTSHPFYTGKMKLVALTSSTRDTQRGSNSPRYKGQSRLAEMRAGFISGLFGKSIDKTPERHVYVIGRMSQCYAQGMKAETW